MLKYLYDKYNIIIIINIVMAISDHVRLVLFHFKIKIDVVNIALRL